MRKPLSYAVFGLIVLFLVDAKATKKPTDEIRPNCINVLQFPQSPLKKIESEALPPRFHNQPLSLGLKHLIDLAMKGTQKQIQGETIFLVGLEHLDPTKLGQQSGVGPSEVLRVPEDLLTAQEIESLQPQLKTLGFDKVLAKSLQIPLLQTYALPRIRLEGYTQDLAATAEGYPVLLEHLPSGQRMEKLNDRASACFVLAGLKILSDKGVLPTLLGLTRTEDGSLMAVFPVPAGYEAVQLTAFRIGLQIATGLRNRNVAEPVEQQNERIQPFENLIARLLASQWPMQNYSLDLETLTAKRPDLNLSQIIHSLDLPLWESFDPSAQKPFFYPHYFATGNSSWFPALFSNPMRGLQSHGAKVEDIEVTAMSTDKSIPLTQRIVHLPLQVIDPVSKLGRITLLRFEFFNSLLNGKAKVNYLNYLLEKSPNEQKALIEFMEFVAAPLKKDYLVTFLSNYRTKRYRDAFQVIDGNLK
jgi:hypothetical protein